LIFDFYFSFLLRFGLIDSGSDFIVFVFDGPAEIDGSEEEERDDEEVFVLA
jgi:hypothetical protein